MDGGNNVRAIRVILEDRLQRVVVEESPNGCLKAFEVGLCSL
jgi:hypothetical protein